MSEPKPHFYNFGPFRINVSERLLFRGDHLVPLTPKALDLLVVLVESRGQLLTKEELMKQVWPDSFVEEANLSHNIYKLREALGDGSNGEKYIETLPRRGYRFVAKVAEIHDPQTHLVVEELSRAHIVVEEDQVASERLALPAARSRKAIWLIAGGLALITLVAGLIYFLSNRGPAVATAAPTRSIAVLPFKPLVANDRDESLEIGMAETLITRLSNLHEITVRPTSAVRKYNDLEQDAVAAGRALNVDSV